MNNINIKKLGVLFIVFLVFTSCEKWIDPDYNVDPNNPIDVSMDLLLASSEVALAYDAGAQMSRTPSMWMQQITGVTSHAAGYEKYVWLEGDVNGFWKWNIYAGYLHDLKILMDKAKESNSPHYEGVAKVLSAYVLGTTTDLWGDIPYSDAFQGNANLKAAYDTQEEIYNTIFTFLDEAITTDLTATTSLYSPGSEDFFYGGDLDKWKKLAYALKARYKLHLSKKNSTVYTEVLTALANGFESSDDDFEFTDFSTKSSEQNPYYQYHEQREGYIGGLGERLMNMLNNNTPADLTDDDPRISIYAEKAKDGSYIGSPAGNPLADQSYIGSYFIAKDAPVSIMSYAELKFIEAEAKLPTDAAGAATAYNMAVKASLAKYGVSNTTWEAANASETETSITLEKIITGKYIALFMNMEVYNDWRRTGFPVLTKAHLAAVGEIPRRWPYPTSERSFNSENYDAAVSRQGFSAGTSIVDRVWWDAN